MNTLKYSTPSVEQPKPLNVSSSGTLNDSRVTEITLSAFSQDQQAILLPMLAHLSNYDCNKWLTWVTHLKPNKALLTQYGFDLNRVRIIHIKEQADLNKITANTLENGNSHTVVVNVPTLSKQDYKRVEKAAKVGDTRALIIKDRDFASQ